jgi:TolB-like protein/Flp pilus assembly protein TadD
MPKRNDTSPIGLRQMPAEERLDSWKDIAAYLKRTVRTVQRWEKTERLPVRRHRHSKLGSVFAVKTEVDTWWASRQPSLAPEGLTPAPAKGRRHLAVLPFANLSGDPEQEYFSDGLTEEMITQLGQIQPDRLGVIARTTMMHYKGTESSVVQIGRELGADYLLEGSVRRADRRVRITAKLVSAKDQTHLWTESYERPLEDVLAIQIEVAKKIARSLTFELLPATHAAWARCSTADPAAHDACLRGRYYWSIRTEESFLKSLEYFQKAAVLDPGYAEAYNGLSVAYDTLAWYGAVPSGEAYRKARAAALQALRINETLAEAHAALAYAKQFSEWNWEEIEAGYRKSLDLDPNLGTGHHWYALFLTSMGRFEEAQSHMRFALEVDPLSPVLNAHLGWILYFARQGGSAVQQLRKTVELDSQFAVGHYFLGLAYEECKEYPAAIKELTAARDLSEGHPAPIAALCHASGLAGKRAEAQCHLEELKEKTTRRRNVSPYFLACAYVGLADKDQAFACLEKAFQERSGWLTNLNVDPALDPLRSSPRYAGLVRRVGLPANTHRRHSASRRAGAAATPR